MVVLSAEIFFHLEDGQQEAVSIIDNLISELNLARQSANRGELSFSSRGTINHPHKLEVMSGHWWIDTTNSMYKPRFEAVDVDGNWRVLDHKHPEFISPVLSEADAKRSAAVWSSPREPGPF